MSLRQAARPARAEDLAALVRLHRAATEELRAQKGGTVWAHQTRRDREPSFALEDPAELVLVGMIDESVVGYARVVVEALDGGRELAVLTDIYVEPGAREVGVGEALLDAAIKWARGRGCVGIDSVALPGMRETKNFFESAGMVARAIVVHRALS